MNAAVGSPEAQPLLARLAHLMVRRRKVVIAAWIALTLFGAFSAGQVSKRWFESFSIPGYSSYEANQRTLKTFGTGEQAPLVAVFHSDGDITKQTGIQKRGRGGRCGQPRLARLVVLLDRRAAPTSRRTATRPSPRSTRRRTPTFSSSVHLDQVRAKLKAATPGRACRPT